MRLTKVMYRDPNVSSTLEVFEKSLNWIKSGSYDASDIIESKISVFSEVLHHLSGWCVHFICMLFSLMLLNHLVKRD